MSGIFFELKSLQMTGAAPMKKVKTRQEFFNRWGFGK